MNISSRSTDPVIIVPLDHRYIPLISQTVNVWVQGHTKTSTGSPGEQQGSIIDQWKANDTIFALTCIALVFEMAQSYAQKAVMKHFMFVAQNALTVGVPAATNSAPCTVVAAISTCHRLTKSTMPLCLPPSPVTYHCCITCNACEVTVPVIV